MLQLDHIAVLGETLDQAAAHCEDVLGLPMLPGGEHDRFGTHNRLLGLAPGLYLEAIAVDPSAAPPADARWFGLDHFHGSARLDKWVCRVPDIKAALQRWPQAGRPVRLRRGSLEWTMAVPADGCLPFDGLFPALIEWHSTVPPGSALSAAGCELQMLTVTHPQAQHLRAALGDDADLPRVTFETGTDPALRADIIASGVKCQLA